MNEIRLPNELPDVTAMTPVQAAEYAYDLESRILAAQKAFDAMLGPIVNAAQEARAKVKEAIVAAGGKALPSESWDITLVTTKERAKYVSVLRQLETLIPEAEYKQAVYLWQPEPAWKADLRKLDALAKKYGGKIADIVREGSPAIESGSGRLVIEPKQKSITKEQNNAKD